MPRFHVLNAAIGAALHRLEKEAVAGENRSKKSNQESASSTGATEADKKQANSSTPATSVPTLSQPAEPAAAIPCVAEATGSFGLAIPPWQVFSEGELARAFGCHPVTIKRAIERGELPPPVRLMGKPTWTGAAILKHLEARLERARESAEIFNRHRATSPKITTEER